MNNSKISVRYAKALLQTALEYKTEDAVRNDIESLLECINTLPDFKAMLESPIIVDSAKVEIFKKLFGSKFNKLTTDFFSLLVKNKREGFLKIICLNYLGFYAKNKNIRRVIITSAVKNPVEVSEKIKQLVKTQDNRSTVELTEKLDPALIGGLIIQIDDKVYDASIKTQLAKVKEKLK